MGARQSSTKLPDKGKPKPTAADPLVPTEVDPEMEAAQWSQEGLCTTIQRFFGWLPRSKSDDLKQQQATPEYAPRAAAAEQTHAQQTDAIVAVQHVFRRYRYMQMWHRAANAMLEIARLQLQEKRAAAEEEAMLSDFRQILSTGFPAQKVSVSGALKNVQLQLVIKPEKEECYITWTPSRKRQARLHLQDVDEVVPVLKEGNKHAPKLAAKVSHRRGLIIACKSHHRGRVILQVANKRERDLLLLGFNRLLTDMDRVEPDLDMAGTLRKSAPRRQSALQFFDAHQRTTLSEYRMPTIGHAGGGSEESSSNEDDAVGENATPQQPNETDPSKPSAESATNIEQFYQTRFDDPAAEMNVSKTISLRPSSTVTDG